MQNVVRDRNSQSLLRALAWLFAVALLAPAWVSAQEKPPAPWDTTKARGVTRDIDFDTSEGTWMSLDVSPDGKWIVFDLLGHVYRITPLTRAAKQNP